MVRSVGAFIIYCFTSSSFPTPSQQHLFFPRKLQVFTCSNPKPLQAFSRAFAGFNVGAKQLEPLQAFAFLLQDQCFQ